MKKTLTLILSLSFLASCSAFNKDTPKIIAGDTSKNIPSTSIDPKGQLSFRLPSGLYSCDHGEKLMVLRTPNNASIKITWKSKTHLLIRDPKTQSGLPRYHSLSDGFVWLDLPWKSLLLNSKTGKPIVNECKG